MIRAALAFAFLVAAYAWAGTKEYDEAISALVDQEARIELLAKLPNGGPIPPRCPKTNDAGEWLRSSIATQADSGPWTNPKCNYGERL